jgi:hypothetical protein
VWASNWLDLEPKKTGKFEAPELSTKSDPSEVDQTQAMQAQDRLGASGGTSIGEAERATPRDEPTSPDQAFADPTIRLSSQDLAKDLPKELDTDRVRLPTRSEIVRAVDSVATSPLPVDPGVLAAPAGLPKVSDPDTERDLEELSARMVRVPAAGRVSSGKVVAGEAEIPPARSLKSVLEAPTLDPSGPHPGPDARWPDLPDDKGFAPVKVGLTDAMRALDPASRRQDAIPTEPTAAPKATTPRWVYPTLALLFLMIVVLLGLLVMKDG